MAELTTGEFKTRTKFNASNSSQVDLIKQKTAELIDLIENLTLRDGCTERETKEFGRLKALAMTEYESAGHWGVKAATV